MYLIFTFCVGLLLSASVAGTQTPTTTPTTTITLTVTESATPTSTTTSSPTFTVTATRTSSLSTTSTATATGTSSGSATATATETSSGSTTATQTGSTSGTATATETRTPTGTTTSTATPTTTTSYTATASVTPSTTLTTIPTHTPTGTSTATTSSSGTYTQTSSSTTSSTTSKSLTSSPSSTTTSTQTFTPTSTGTSSRTFTHTVTATPTNSRTSTASSSLTATKSATHTSTTTTSPTRTSTDTATATHTATGTVTSTNTASATATSSTTPTPSRSPSPTPTYTRSMTNSPSATSTVTSTPIPTHTATLTASPSRTPSTTRSQSATGSSTPSQVVYVHTLTIIFRPTSTTTDAVNTLGGLVRVIIGKVGALDTRFIAVTSSVSGSTVTYTAQLRLLGTEQKRSAFVQSLMSNIPSSSDMQREGFVSISDGKTTVLATTASFSALTFPRGAAFVQRFYSFTATFAVAGGLPGGADLVVVEKTDGTRLYTYQNTGKLTTSTLTFDTTQWSAVTFPTTVMLSYYLNSSNVRVGKSVEFAYRDRAFAITLGVSPQVVTGQSNLIISYSWSTDSSTYLGGLKTDSIQLVAPDSSVLTSIAPTDSTLMSGTLQYSMSKTPQRGDFKVNYLAYNGLASVVVSTFKFTVDKTKTPSSTPSSTVTAVPTHTTTATKTYAKIAIRFSLFFKTTVAPTLIPSQIVAGLRAKLTTKTYRIDNVLITGSKTLSKRTFHTQDIQISGIAQTCCDSYLFDTMASGISSSLPQMAYLLNLGLNASQVEQLAIVYSPTVLMGIFPPSPAIYQRISLNLTGVNYEVGSTAGDFVNAVALGVVLSPGLQAVSDTYQDTYSWSTTAGTEVTLNYRLGGAATIGSVRFTPGTRFVEVTTVPTFPVARTNVQFTITLPLSARSFVTTDDILKFTSGSTFFAYRPVIPPRYSTCSLLATCSSISSCTSCGSTCCDTATVTVLPNWQLPSGSLTVTWEPKGVSPISLGSITYTSSFTNSPILNTPTFNSPIFNTPTFNTPSRNTPIDYSLVSLPGYFQQPNKNGICPETHLKADERLCICNTDRFGYCNGKEPSRRGVGATVTATVVAAAAVAVSMTSSAATSISTSASATAASSGASTAMFGWVFLKHMQYIALTATLRAGDGSREFAEFGESFKWTLVTFGKQECPLRSPLIFYIVVSGCLLIIRLILYLLVRKLKSKGISPNPQNLHVGFPTTKAVVAVKFAKDKDPNAPAVPLSRKILQKIVDFESYYMFPRFEFMLFKFAFTGLIFGSVSSFNDDDCLQTGWSVMSAIILIYCLVVVVVSGKKLTSWLHGAPAINESGIAKPKFTWVQTEPNFMGKFGGLFSGFNNSSYGYSIAEFTREGCLAVLAAAFAAGNRSLKEANKVSNMSIVQSVLACAVYIAATLFFLKKRPHLRKIGNIAMGISLLYHSFELIVLVAVSHASLKSRSDAGRVLANLNYWTLFGAIIAMVTDALMAADALYGMIAGGTKKANGFHLQAVSVAPAPDNNNDTTTTGEPLDPSAPAAIPESETVIERKTGRKVLFIKIIVIVVVILIITVIFLAVFFGNMNS